MRVEDSNGEDVTDDPTILIKVPRMTSKGKEPKRDFADDRNWFAQNE